MRVKFVAAFLSGLSALVGVQGVAGAASAVKPEANKDHWHAAYGVYICDRYLPPVQSSGNDPTGVHTHGDGLIHIHPFVPASAGANAVLARFFEAEPLKVTATSIKVGSTTYKTGGKCGTKTATVRTLTWAPGAKGKPVVHTGDPSKLRLEDQITFSFVYAPAEATVPVPPSQKELDDPADLPPPALTAAELAKLPAPPVKAPPVPVLPAGAPPTKLTVRDLVRGTGLEAKTGTRLYVRYRAMLWNGTELDTTSWVAGDQPAGLPRLGRNRLMPGLEKGLLGMKVGGLRQIIIPPSELGSNGSVVKPTDTLVFIVQLVAVAGATNSATT